MSGFGIVRTTVYFHKQTATRLGIAVSGVLTIRHGPLDLIEKKAGAISGMNSEPCSTPPYGRIEGRFVPRNGGGVDASGTR